MEYKKRPESADGKHVPVLLCLLEILQKCGNVRFLPIFPSKTK